MSRCSRALAGARRRTGDRAAGRPSDDGVTLVEVMIAFVVLMIALIPLSYLFTTALESAGQSTFQQTALSISEKWMEVLANTTPPVNSFGEVVVDSAEPPQGPAPSFTVNPTGGSVGAAFDGVSSISVTSAAQFAPVTNGVDQYAQVITGSGASQVTTQIAYSAVNLSTNTLTCATNPCSSSTVVMASTSTVSQATIVTPTETRGNTTYSLTAKYSWATTQNNGLSTAPDLCQAGTPQLLKLTVTVSWGPNADGNNIQESEMLNYPPSGVQTLGFIALQLTGDTNAYDTQNPTHPWSYRVQSIPVTVQDAGLQTLNLYPDSYGCVFAQVQPGNYTVTVGPPVNGTPTGTTYGTPTFVADSAGTSANVTNHVWTPPTSEPTITGTQPTVPVSIGAVTNVQTTLTGDYPGFDQASVVNLTYPSTTAVDDGVQCPGANQISCISDGQGSSGSAAVNWLNQSSGRWTSASVPAGVTRIESNACAGSVACIGVGYGSSGAVILQGEAGVGGGVTADSVTSGTALGAGASLNQVACPSATQCVAIGRTSAGVATVLSGTISATAGADTWTQYTFPSTITSLSSLVCPTGGTGCAAVATTASGGAPVVVTGPMGTGTWSVGTGSGFTLSTLAQVTCPTTTACVAIGSGKVGASTTVTPVVLTGTVTGGTGLGSTGSTVAWSVDSVTGSPVTLSGLSQIICPGTATNKCLITGTGLSGTTTEAVILYGAPAGSFGVEVPQDAGGAITSLTQVVCPSSSICTAIGSLVVTSPSISVTPMLFTGSINQTATSADTWHNDALPIVSGGSITGFSKVVCPSTTACLVAGTGTNASQPQGYLVDTSNQTTSGATWNTAALPSGDNVAYFDGIDCTSGSTGTCSAAGATPTGAVLLTSTGGPSGGWADLTPSGLSGSAVSGIPIEINNGSLYVNAVTAGASPNVSQLPALYPFSGGYGLWAGDCASEGTTSSYAVASVATIPGGTSGVTSGMSTPIVPLGLLSLQVTHAGLPDAGATVTLTANTSGCNADTYSMPATGADGLSRADVPFGSYSLTVAGTSIGTVVVAGNSATVGSTSYPLPTPVPVSV